MGFDFEQLLGTSGAGLGDAYEDAVADAVHQDHPYRAGTPTDAMTDPDPGDEDDRRRELRIYDDEDEGL